MRKNILFILLSLALPLASLRAEIQPRVDARRLNMGAAQRSFFFPGWGQWYKGDKERAISIVVVEASFLGLSYYSYQKAKDAEKDFRMGQAPYSRYTRKADQANFLLLAAGFTWIYGICDAYFAAPPGLSASVSPKGDVAVAWNVKF